MAEPLHEVAEQRLEELRAVLARLESKGFDGSSLRRQLAYAEQLKGDARYQDVHHVVDDAQREAKRLEHGSQTRLRAVRPAQENINPAIASSVSESQASSDDALDNTKLEERIRSVLGAGLLSQVLAEQNGTSLNEQKKELVEQLSEELGKSVAEQLRLQQPPSARLTKRMALETKRLERIVRDAVQDEEVQIAINNPQTEQRLEKFEKMLTALQVSKEGQDGLADRIADMEQILLELRQQDKSGSAALAQESGTSRIELIAALNEEMQKTVDHMEHRLVESFREEIREDAQVLKEHLENIPGELLEQLQENQSNPSTAVLTELPEQLSELIAKNIEEQLHGGVFEKLEERLQSGIEERFSKLEETLVGGMNSLQDSLRETLQTSQSPFSGAHEAPESSRIHEVEGLESIEAVFDSVPESASINNPSNTGTGPMANALTASIESERIPPHPVRESERESINLDEVTDQEIDEDLQSVILARSESEAQAAEANVGEISEKMGSERIIKGQDSRIIKPFHESVALQRAKSEFEKEETMKHQRQKALAEDEAFESALNEAVIKAAESAAFSAQQDNSDTSAEMVDDAPENEASLADKELDQLTQSESGLFEAEHVSGIIDAVQEDPESQKFLQGDIDETVVEEAVNPDGTAIVDIDEHAETMAETGSHIRQQIAAAIEDEEAATMPEMLDMNDDEEKQENDSIAETGIGSQIEEQNDESSTVDELPGDGSGSRPRPKVDDDASSSLLSSVLPENDEEKEAIEHGLADPTADPRAIRDMSDRKSEMLVSGTETDRLVRDVIDKAVSDLNIGLRNSDRGDDYAAVEVNAEEVEGLLLNALTNAIANSESEALRQQDARKETEDDPEDVLENIENPTEPADTDEMIEALLNEDSGSAYQQVDALNMGASALSATHIPALPVEEKAAVPFAGNPMADAEQLAELSKNPRRESTAERNVVKAPPREPIDPLAALDPSTSEHEAVQLEEMESAHPEDVTVTHEITSSESAIRRMISEQLANFPVGPMATNVQPSAVSAAIDRGSLRSEISSLLQEEEFRQQIFGMLAMEMIEKPGILAELSGLRSFLREEIEMAIDRASSAIP